MSSYKHKKLLIHHSVVPLLPQEKAFVTPPMNPTSPQLVSANS